MPFTLYIVMLAPSEVGQQVTVCESNEQVTSLWDYVDVTCTNQVTNQTLVTDTYVVLQTLIEHPEISAEWLHEDDYKGI